MNAEMAVNVSCENLDVMIEKANRLIELLREAQQIIDLLSGKEKLKS